MNEIRRRTDSSSVLQAGKTVSTVIPQGATDFQSVSVTAGIDLATESAFQERSAAVRSGGRATASQKPRVTEPAGTASTKPCHATSGADTPVSRAAAYQLEAVALHKTYRRGPARVAVLKGASLAVARGEFLAIVGQSGSGKSTLLHVLATLDAPDDGEVYFRGHRIDRLPAGQRDRLRNRHFGMIFQFYHLLPELNTLENVLAPLMIDEGILGYWQRRRRYRHAAMEWLDAVGLGHRLKHRPRELSGGEMQRAAIARALVGGPELLLADEPTGNLDRETGGDVLELLHSLNRRQELTIVMVTHDPSIAQQADRVIRLVDGRIEAA